MKVWTVSYNDDDGEEQIVAFARTPEAATSQAMSFLLDRDAELALPWKKITDGTWSMTATSLEDETPALTLFLQQS